MPIAFRISANGNVRLTIQPQLSNTLCVISYDINGKPVLIEQDFIDQSCVTHLVKAYVYLYSF